MFHLLPYALCAAACSLALAQQGGTKGKQAQQWTTWSDYLGAPDTSHYSALAQINRSNVNKLAIAWSYETGDNVPYAFNPIVVDGVMYVMAKNTSIVALNAETGREL